jgi:hypothetical protein
MYTKVSLSDPGIRKIVSACYPAYKGRKVKIRAATTYSMSNYWDGGTRDYVMAYHLESGLVKSPSQTTTSPFRDQAHATIEIPEGIAMVEHTIFQGKDVGITIHLNPANMAKLLPAGAGEAR